MNDVLYIFLYIMATPFVLLFGSFAVILFVAAALAPFAGFIYLWNWILKMTLTKPKETK